mmetsp:Transcript_16014/g.41103  ORF Transcript_16014/g.41103 Transcript_16014/m.41103 type:complete len:139 (+) Transcript_16014:681-1097(+)
MSADCCSFSATTHRPSDPSTGTQSSQSLVTKQRLLRNNNNKFTPLHSYHDYNGQGERGHTDPRGCLLDSVPVRVRERLVPEKRKKKEEEEKKKRKEKRCTETEETERAKDIERQAGRRSTGPADINASDFLSSVSCVK